MIDTAATVEDILGSTLEEIRITTGALSVSARMLDASGVFLRPVKRCGISGDFADKPVAVGEGITGWVAGAQRHCYIADVRDIEDLKLHPDLTYIEARSDTRCEYGVRVSFKGDRIGVLNIEHAQVDGLWDSRSYLEALATQVAYAGYHRRRIKRTERDSDQERVNEVVRTAMALAHDFRHALESLRIPIEKTLAGRGTLVPSARRRLEEVVRDCDARAEAIRDFMRKFPELVEGREVVQVPNFVGGLIERYRRKVTSDTKGPEVTFYFPDYADIPEVICAPTLVEWVITSLFDNSRAASSSDGLSIWVALAVEASGGQVDVIITDDGPGVPDEALDELLSWERSRLEVHGTGLALPISRLFLEGMGGTIIPRRPADGKGLEVVVRLPSRIASEDPDEEQ